MYETFAHTADLGLRIRAPSLDSLFAEAGEALMSIILDDPTTIEPREAWQVQIEGDDLAYLLVDWLNALLYRFDVGHRVYRRFQVQVTPGGLSASAWGEPLDPARHRLQREVKAITYHGLRVEPTEAGWLAEVIVDI
ncbi:MAG: archease [Gemmataceae bacterium]|nr:archease [Gemmataceae bacterium]MDW8266247.1 archease [Gemmataceae bacterium]